MKKFTFVSFLLIALSGFAQTEQARNPLGHRGQEFGGIRTFLRAPYVDNIEKVNADIVVMGVPFDEGTTARPGARYAPRDIREGSLIYAWTDGFFYIDDEKWVLQGTRWTDVGDIDVEPLAPVVTFGRITEAVRAIRRKNALPVILGGDHSISFPVIRAYGLPSLTVVHFDAHLDSYGHPPTRDEIPTFVTDHGQWVSAVAQLPGIKIVQIGMRGISNDEHGLKSSRKYGATDPALAPGTGTVEVGGLIFQQLSDILRSIPSKGRLVGMDIVEVNPYYDPTGVTAQTAARLIIDLLGAAFPSK